VLGLILGIISFKDDYNRRQNMEWAVEKEEKIETLEPGKVEKTTWNEYIVIVGR